MRPRRVKSRLNPKQRIVVILMDLALLVELTLCMYKASANPEYMAGEFMRLYVPLLVVTVVASRIFLRRFRSPEALPGPEAPDAPDVSEAAAADAR